VPLKFSGETLSPELQRRQREAPLEEALAHVARVGGRAAEYRFRRFNFD